MAQYKTITTTPAGAPAVTMAKPPAAHAEPNKPGNPAKAEHTTEMVKEKIEPGRDIFANPIQDDNVNPQTTASVNPAVLEAKKKAKEEKMRSQIEKLKSQVGPLRASDIIVKDAIEQAEFDAIVRDPSLDDSKPKEDEQKAESTAPQRDGVEEKTEEEKEKEEKTEEKKAGEKAGEKTEVEEETEEKVTKPKKEGTHDKVEKDESLSSIQSAPSPTHDEEEGEREKKPLSPEEIEADRVRQSLWRNEAA